MRARPWIAVAAFAFVVIGLAAWFADRGERSLATSDSYDAPPPAIGTEFVVRVPLDAVAERSDLEYISPPASINDPQFIESMILVGDAVRFEAGDRFVLRELVVLDNNPVMHARVASDKGEFWMLGPILMNKLRCEPVSSTP